MPAISRHHQVRTVGIWDVVTIAVAVAALLAVTAASIVFLASATPTATPTVQVPAMTPGPGDPDGYDVLCFKPRFRSHPTCLRSGDDATGPVGGRP